MAIESLRIFPFATWAMISSAVILMSGTCRSTGTSSNPASDILSTENFIGPWVASTVDVEIVSKDKIGGDDHLHYESRQLASQMGRKPTMTIYNVDGSYREEIYSQSDSLIQAKAGFWHFYQDSLFMRLDVTGSPKIAFQAAKEGAGLKLYSRVDWDGDGAKDDQMTVTLRRP